MITGYSNIISVTTLPGLLLDVYPSAAAAYSVRKLRTAYTGSAIRVRRSSDNTEQDIGFSSGNLDTTSLTTFCSGTNGFVTTWYDQSGNGNNATQTTAANQPQIVSSGAVINLNSKPSLQFDGSNDMLKYTGLLYTTNTVFGTVVFSHNSANQYSQILSQNSGGVGRSSLLQLNDTSPRKSAYFFNNGTSYNNLSSGTISSNTQTLLTNYSFSNNYYNALNGGLANNNISGQAFTPTSANGSSIGGTPINTDFLNGVIQEILVWNSDQSSNKTGIESNINSYYAIY